MLAVAYVYVHGQDMVYARRLVLVHRCVASYMMLLVMLHIYRNVWDNNAAKVRYSPHLTGCVIYLVMSLVCFTGYCLPRSNVSYHAMMVLINLLSVVPLYGRALVVAAFGHRAPALSTNITVCLWLMHTVGALLLTLLIYEHMGSVQGQFDAPLSPCRVHGDQPVVAAQLAVCYAAGSE